MFAGLDTITSTPILYTVAPSSTDRRTLVNQANALKSTGPATAPGKANSRLNGLVHGLRSTLPVLPGEDPDAYDRRRAEWIVTYRPADDVELTLVETALAAAIGLERCRRHEAAAVADRLAAAADDRALAQLAEVDALTPDLPTRPSSVVARLHRSAPGCRWLLARWRHLHAELGRRTWDAVPGAGPEPLRPAP